MMNQHNNSFNWSDKMELGGEGELGWPSQSNRTDLEQGHWPNQPNQSELEEGELSDELSNEDYSPGSLVIDHTEPGTSNAASSGFATPPIDRLQATLDFDSHPIFGNSSSSPSSTQDLTSSSLQPYNPLPTQDTPTHVPVKTATPLIPQLAPLPPLLPVDKIEGRGERLRYLIKTDVPAEGSPPIDTLCIYQFTCSLTFIEIIARRERAPLIPIKNVYLKAIPGLKQNVLSARISKLGIRSLVLSEPYVSTVKKLNIGLTGSSHYITVSDFIKICNYFRKPVEAFVPKLDLIMSSQTPDDILRLFNDPDHPASRDLLNQLTTAAGRRDVGRGDFIPGIGGGAMIRGSGSQAWRNEENRREEAANLASVDARKLTLPNGSNIYVLVKEGHTYMPNPELAKILPAVNRTAMEHFRTTYGISVTQATKTDMDVMKYVGVVSAKAGRTLLYKVADVVAMFHHWKAVVPSFITEMSQGKILGEKVVINPQGFPLTGGHSPYSRTRTTSSPTPLASSSLLSSQVAPSNHTHHHAHTQDRNFTSIGASLSTSSSVQSNQAQKRAWHGGVVSGVNNMSPTSQQRSLTPDQFQLPVQMLNSLAAEGVATSGHVGGRVTSQQETYGVSEEQKRKRVKRRNSSISGSPLDDQDLEYSSLMWGAESLTLLCPKDGGEEPYITIPELVQKVLHHRSYVNMQQRNRLGVAVHPATSLQIHALRARGSLDNSTGNVKLMSLSDAVKIAVSGHFDIPGTVIQKLSAVSKIPIQDILNPVPVSDIETTPSSASARPLVHVKQEVMSSEGGADLNDMALNDGTFAPSHPDIVQAPHDWRLDGDMCQVKWGDNSVVVYTTGAREHFMGLYQIYDVLFKCYVTRMNFKMRMRKLDIRSNRAPSSVRMKLVELGALPSHCPVCGLITVVEMETLAKSYGITPPQVFYDQFIGKGGQQQQKSHPPLSKPHPQPSKPHPSVPILPRPPTISHQPPSPSQLPPNVFSYQFDPSDDPTPSQPGHTPSSSSQVPRPSIPGHTPSSSQVPRLPLPSHAQQYGIVPYLTSSSERLGEESASLNSPNLITTSLGTKLTNQIHSPQQHHSGPLVVSIPREYTLFKVVNRSHAPQQGGMASRQVGGVRGTAVTGYSGSRGKVLQNLAKKISQKSRKISNHLNSSRQLPSHAQPADAAKGPLKRCPSCGEMNPQHKKRCGFCSEFVVGVACSSCSSLNYYRSKSCGKCGMTLNWGASPMDKEPSHDLSHDQGVVPGSGASDSSSHPTSPTSPKYSAPPIRSAVLKSLFPQQNKSGVPPDPSNKPHPSNKGAQQVMSKTVYAGAGNITSSRKCPECGQLNTRMAKKCVHCRSHLQGRPCSRCGRPNLNHVTECYKCGATLPPATSSKWVYVGSHSGRAYKSTATMETIETRALLSRAPISCMRCTKFRSSGYFKCGRCGDAFKTRPLVDPLWEDTSEDTPPPSKRRRESNEEQTKQSEKIEPSVLEQLARNLIHVGVQDHLIPLLVTTQSQSKDQLEAAEEEFKAAEVEYQVALTQKTIVEEKFNSAKAELDYLLSQMEHTNHTLQGVSRRAEEAREETEHLPTQLQDIRRKMEASVSLFSADE